MTFDIEKIMHRQGWHRNPVLNGQDLTTFSTETTEGKERLAFAKEYDGKSAFLYGAPGRGKTHLARGIMKDWLKNHGEYSAIYWPLMQLLGDLRRRMNGGTGESPDEVIDRLCNFEGLLIVDELGRSKGDHWDRDSVVYQLIDRRLHLQTIWISNYNLKTLSRIYDEAITSRLSMAHNVPFPDSMKDFRKKR